MPQEFEDISVLQDPYDYKLEVERIQKLTKMALNLLEEESFEDAKEFLKDILDPSRHVE